MTNIYQEIHNDYVKQVEQLEADYARYLAAHNKIKGNKTWRFIGRTGLRGIAIAFYVSAIIVALLILGDYLNWGIGLVKRIIELPKNAPWYEILFRIAVYSLVLLWPAIAFMLSGFLLSLVRKRNKLIHSLSELLEEILARTGANIQKAKESQKDFELFAAEIAKKHVQENSNQANLKG